MSSLQLYGQAATRTMTVTQRADEASEERFKLEDLDVDQWTPKPGETIPLIFCGPDGGSGVWISPPLVRQGYQSDNENIQSNYGYVLSDGELGTISADNIWHGSKKYTDFADKEYVQQYSKTPANYNTIKFAVSVGEQFNEFYLDTVYTVSAGSSIEIKTQYLSIVRSKIVVSGASAITDNRTFTGGEEFASAAGVSRARIRLYNAPGSYGFNGYYFDVYAGGSRIANGVLVPGRVGGSSSYSSWYTGDGVNEIKFVVVANPSTPIGEQCYLDIESETSVGAGSWDVSWGNNSRTVSVSGDSGYINGDGSNGMNWKMLAAAKVNQTITLTEHVKSSYGIGERPPSDSSGSGGTFFGLTTLLMRVPIPVTSDAWRRQAHIYITSGIKVPRLIEGTTGSSALFPDLIAYLMRRNGLVPDDLIDLDSMRQAALFTKAQQMFYSGVLATTQNLSEVMTRVAPFFLLMPTQKDGRYGFRPVLPVNGTALNKGSVSSVASFANDNIMAGSYSRTYRPLSERKPFAALMVWRNQPPGKPGGRQVTEVRYTGTATSGPYEQFDLSDFCTTEDHAIRAGKYALARRKHVTHTIAFRTSLAASNITPGDIIDVTLDREDSYGESLSEKFYYQVEQISEDQFGTVAIYATHFPVNSALQSLVALDIEDTAMAVA